MAGNFTPDSPESHQKPRASLQTPPPQRMGTGTSYDTCKEEERLLCERKGTQVAWQELTTSGIPSPACIDLRQRHSRWQHSPREVAHLDTAGRSMHVSLDLREIMRSLPLYPKHTLSAAPSWATQHGLLSSWA